MHTKKVICKDMLYMGLGCLLCLVVVYCFLYANNSFFYDILMNIRITNRMTKAAVLLDGHRYEEAIAIYRDLLKIHHRDINDSNYRSCLYTYASLSLKVGESSEFERCIDILDKYYAVNTEQQDYTKAKIDNLRSPRD